MNNMGKLADHIEDIIFKMRTFGIPKSTGRTAQGVVIEAFVVAFGTLEDECAEMRAQLTALQKEVSDRKGE
jgi:hypothetical protein